MLDCSAGVVSLNPGREVIKKISCSTKLSMKF